MKRLALTITVTLISLISFIPLSAALPSNVTWTTSVEKTSDTEGTIVWHADIKEGWHIYGLEMPSLPDTPTPPPTSFSITPSDSLELIGDVESSAKIESHYARPFQCPGA